MPTLFAFATVMIILSLFPPWTSRLAGQGQPSSVDYHWVCFPPDGDRMMIVHGTRLQKRYNVAIVVFLIVTVFRLIPPKK
jgi:hypothetical protein